jgi:hypothetical protein
MAPIKKDQRNTRLQKPDLYFLTISWDSIQNSL